jgi:hypothetical protein
MIFGILVSYPTCAQCDNLGISLTATNSTCQANGVIRAKFTGADTVNIMPATVLYKIDNISAGQNYVDWTTQPAGGFSGLPPGMYKVFGKATCSQGGAIVEHFDSIAVAGNYTVMEASISGMSPSMNCVDNGVMPVMITAGLAPYTVTVTSSPAGYSGPVGFNPSAPGTFRNLAQSMPGQYVITVSDKCAHTVVLNPTVPALSSDFPAAADKPFNETLNAPFSPDGANCNTVGVYFDRLDPNHELFTFWNEASKYYEVGFVVNGSGTAPSSWVSAVNVYNRVIFSMPAGNTYKSMRDADNFLIPYIRVKNPKPGAGSCQVALATQLKLKTPPFQFITKYEDMTCDHFTIRFQPEVTQEGVWCYPYKWHIKNQSGTQVFPSSGTVSSSNRSEQTATQIPYGSTIYFEDNEGFTWFWNIPARQPDKNGIRMAYNSSFCMPNTGKNYIYIGMKDYTLKAGTRIKYISGPTQPYHLEFVTAADIQNFVYPYSYRDGVHTPQQYEDILPGTYEFEVEDCGAVMRVTAEVRQYTVSGFSVANQQHTCEGLKVTPVGDILDNGSPWETYYSVQSGPPGVNFDSTGVARGGSLILPVTGTYTIKITHDRATSQTGACPAAVLTVAYSRNTLRIDPNITAAYKCSSESTGFIRIKGMYGGPDGTGSTYKYELKSGSTVLLSNSSGEFRYGSGGDVFTVVVSDEICRTSFEQQVSVYDLSLAGAASGSRDVCTGETIRLYSINLGSTTYNWEGPNGWSSTQRNPVITNATAAMSGDYILTVTPQSCSETVRDTIRVTVAPQSPKPAVVNINPSYCQNAAAPSLETASGATALPGYVLEWLKSDGTVIAPPNPIVTGVVGETVYKLRQRPVSGTGCTSEDSLVTVTVTISPIPAAQLSVTQRVSCGDTEFDLIVSPATPGYYYKVYDENGVFLKRSATGSGDITNLPVPNAIKIYTVAAVVEKGGCETPETLRTRVNIGRGEPAVPNNIVPSIASCGATKFDVTVTPAQSGVAYRLYDVNMTFVKASAVGSGLIDNIDFPPSPPNPDSAYFYVSAVIGATCETPSSDWERILVRSGGKPMSPPKASITTQWNCGDSLFSLVIAPVSAGYYYKLYMNTAAFDSTVVGSGALSGIPVPKNSSEVYYLSSIQTLGSAGAPCESRDRTRVDIEEDLPDSPLPSSLFLDSLQCSGSSFNIIVRPAKSGYYYRVHVPPLNAVIDSSAVVPLGDTVAVIRNLPAPMVPETWYVSAVVDTGRCMSPRVTPIYINPNTQGASPSDIDVAGASACMGMPTTLIASSTTVQNPVFRWYASQTSTDTLHEGPMFVTDSLTQTTTYYVSVSGDGYCENPSGSRKEVTVNINPPSSPLDISVRGDTVICSGNFATLIASSTSVMNPLFKWYPNYTSDIVLSHDSIYRTATQINNNDNRVYTQVYVAVYGDDFCETAKSDRKEVLVAIKRNGDGSLIELDPATAGDTIICSGRTATLRVTSTVPDPVFTWYDSQSSNTPLHAGDTFTTPPLDTTTTYYVAVSSFHICENSVRKAITVTVYPSLPGDIDITSRDTTVCAGGTVTLSVSSSRPGVIFRWYLERSSDSVVHTGADYTVTVSKTTSFFVGIAAGSDSCETAYADRKEVIAKVHEVYPGTISVAGDSTICSGSAPGVLSISGATGGTGTYTYLWQSRQDYSSVWIDRATGLTYQPGPIFSKTHFRVNVSDGTCSDNLSDSITIDVLADGAGAYPDVRISVCSDISALNLSKYVDTLGTHSLLWTAASGSASVTLSGEVSVSELSKARSHTYIYMASNVCVTDNASKLYLRVIDGNFSFPLDTVAVCYLHAESININQIFGIEADGVIIYDGGSALDPYIRKITSGDHAGTVIFNGRSAYLEPGLLPEINYHGELTKQVTFRYVSSISGCLKGREFKIVVVLTPDITK